MTDPLDRPPNRPPNGAPATPLDRPLGPPSPTLPPRPTVPGPDRLLVGLLCVVAGVGAITAIAFLPVRVGSVPFPVVVPLAAGLLWGLPTLAFALTGRLAAAVAPAAVFIVTMVAVSLWPRPLMAGHLAVTDWRIVLLFGAASVSASLTIGVLWGEVTRRAILERGAVTAVAATEPNAPPVVRDTERDHQDRPPPAAPARVADGRPGTAGGDSL